MKLFDWCIKNLCGRKERVKSLKAVDLDVYMLFDKQTHAVTHQKWKIQMIHLIMCPPVRIKLHMEWNFWWMHQFFMRRRYGARGMGGHWPWRLRYLLCMWAKCACGPRLHRYLDNYVLIKLLMDRYKGNFYFLLLLLLLPYRHCMKGIL